MKCIRHGETVVLVMDARTAAYLRGITEQVTGITAWRDVRDVSTLVTIKLDDVLEGDEMRDFDLFEEVTP